MLKTKANLLLKLDSNANGETNMSNAQKIQYSIEDYKIINNSILFDIGWYVTTYQNIGNIDPAAHFLLHGYKELNNPSLFFNTADYYNLYPDVKHADVNPLLHFEKVGKIEIRFLNHKMREDYNLIKESRKFDELFYINRYFEDDYYADPVWHFLVMGCNNDNNPNQSFDIKKYCRQNHDILGGENPFVHYLKNFGSKQIFISRKHFKEYMIVSESKLFDEKFYTAQIGSWDHLEMDACYHYINFGYREGKNPSSKFTNEEYCNANVDVDFSCISPLGHYLTYGIKEGRFKSKHEEMYSIISNSEYFDKDFYIKNLKTDKVDPVEHYIRYGCKEGRPTSHLFSTKVYNILNPDVYHESVNALYHYESTGKEEGRNFAIELSPKHIFPEEAFESEGEGYYENPEIKRIAIVASYSGDSRLSKSTEYLVNELKKVCGKIIFVMDNPIINNEIDRIKNLCSYYICKRHEEYDFGSYKYGLLACKQIYNLSDFDELMMCNDSVYGPISGFEHVFSAMKARDVDFWGLTAAKNSFGESLQSFFYVFLPIVFLSKTFNNFFESISKESNREQVVIKYEFQFTLTLFNEGFTYDSFVDKSFNNICRIPTKRPLTLLQEYGFPVIKKKVLTGTCLESKQCVLDCIKNENCELYDIICEEGTVDLVKSKEINSTKTDYMAIKNSRFFDHDYYLNEYFNLNLEGIDPIDHYLKFGFLEGKNPSNSFSTREYYEINPDVKRACMNPLLHYEKFGKHQNRQISIDPLQQWFDDTAVDYEKQFFKFKLGKTKRVAIFSSFAKDSKISAHVIYYLKELSKCVDYIAFIADNPILKSEVNKISNIVGYAKFKRHNEYDFGSYKIGFLFLQQQDLLDQIDEIIFCNDSCVGPIFSFTAVFEEMSKRACDVWGMTLSNYTGLEHIQSYFILLKNKVFTSKPFKEFINNVKIELSSYCVIEKYEMGLTKTIKKSGFVYDSFVPACADALHNPIMYPLEQMKNALPLVKMKAITGYYNKINVQELLLFVQRANPELAKIIAQQQVTFTSSKFSNRFYEISHFAPIAKKMTLPITIHFYVENISMFSARSLFEEMRKDIRFNPYLVVIPDIRFGRLQEMQRMAQAYEELCASYGQDNVINSYDDATQSFIDFTNKSQMVCFSSHYNLSHSYYTPRYVAKKCLTVYVPYGFFRSKYDRFLYASENFSIFWRVFLETKHNLEEAKKFAKSKGQNCIISGYSKMDSLSTPCDSKQNIRKKIILAPHHSVDGGFNRIMTLSNFLRYQNVFLILPRKYSDIDFVFRPHPMLFDCLRQNKFWGKQKVTAYIDALLAYENVTISDCGNYFDIFAESDAIIHDCGSFLVEYFYTQKPQCYLLKDKQQIIDIYAPLGRLCLNRCYKAFTENDIYSFIENTVINGIDPLKHERERFSSETIMINYPNASKAIIDHILAALPPQSNNNSNNS